MAPVAAFDAAGEVSGANLGLLVRRLLLFDEVILDSYGMRELPQLIEALGPKGFCGLLASGALKIRADAWVTGEIGKSDMIPKPLPLGSYHIAWLVPQDRKKHISDRLGVVREMYLGKHTSSDVRNAIVDSLVPFPEGDTSLDGTTLAPIVARREVVTVAARHVLNELHGSEIATGEFSLSFIEIGESEYSIDTDLGERHGLAPEQVALIGQKVILALAGFHHRLEEMRFYDALTGFRPEEQEMINAWLGQLAGISTVPAIEAAAQEGRLSRVLDIAGLPDPPTAEGTVDVGKLLAFRESDDLRQFREWLRTSESLSDKGIADQVNALSGKVAAFIHSPAGKAVRLVFGLAAGMLPAAAGVPVPGEIIGGAVGAADTFLLDKLVRKPGPVLVLAKNYRSIYTAP